MIEIRSVTYWLREIYSWKPHPVVISTDNWNVNRGISSVFVNFLSPYLIVQFPFLIVCTVFLIWNLPSNAPTSLEPPSTTCPEALPNFSDTLLATAPKFFNPKEPATPSAVLPTIWPALLNLSRAPSPKAPALAISSGPTRVRPISIMVSIRKRSSTASGSDDFTPNKIQYLQIRKLFT